MVRKVFFFLLITTTSLIASAEEFYVNANTGNDANPGNKLQPLKTIAEAARRINVNAVKATTTIILSAGVYPLTETVLFNNNKFSTDNRLIIRAEILPDDPNWNPQGMPIITTIICIELRKRSLLDSRLLSECGPV